MKHVPRRMAFASLLITLLFGGLALAQDAAVEPLSAFPQSLLSIRTAKHTVVNFKVWSADTPGRERQGLMFVRHIDEHEGMLFVFPDYQPVTMWMKNTYIGLDMVFINASGRIDYIARNATPLSTSIIGSPTPALAVLELNAGSCDRLGIEVNDSVHSPILKKPK